MPGTENFEIAAINRLKGGSFYLIVLDCATSKKKSCCVRKNVQGKLSWDFLKCKAALLKLQVHAFNLLEQKKLNLKLFYVNQLESTDTWS